MSIKNIFTFIFYISTNTITTQNTIPVKNNNNFFHLKQCFIHRSNTVPKINSKVKLLPLFNF